MQKLRNVPIQKKLRFVILATCTAALSVASAALFALQFFFFQRDYKRDLVSVAEIVSDMSAGVIAFGREDSTAEVLSALKSKPQILRASVVLPNGTLFAKFDKNPVSTPTEDLRQDGFHEQNGDLIYVHPVMDSGERIASLYLHSDYRVQAMQLHGLYASILIAVLATSFLVAVLVSSKLERVIAEPIQTLAETAKSIAAKGDYSVRAPKLADDEVGMFTESFNGMLAQIENRDTALRHEIEERARAEQELQRTQRQLIDASRQAGMAEVATGVLHNVGNVLNSVNVSATLIAERLSQSRTNNLVKAAQLLQQCNGNLADFLTKDPKGKLLPGYLAEASQHLAKEQEEAMGELAQLNKNIEHIKDIVATQQAYAKVSGLIETISLESLVEDALRMNAGSFERHDIRAVREYEPLPPALVDKHKVLQILVNLMRNAKYAIAESSSSDKTLTLSIRRKDEKTACIKIIDTGIGIPTENLTRIFSHGFTTRKEGHGFGLHSSALAAQQMAGRLTAHSEGPGCGATFTLELPLAVEQPAAA